MGVVGIDIGGSSVKAVRLAHADDAAGATARVPLTAPDTPSVIEAIRDAGETVGAAADDLLGCCLPGLVDAESGALTRAANLPSLIGARPAEMIRDALGRPPAAITTDAAAWGAGVWHAERTPGRLLVLAMGTGIGGAFLIDGEPATLDGVSAGHVGMLDVSLGEDAPPLAGDGTPGVLEAYCGGRALLARFGADLDEERLAREIASMDERDPAIGALAKGLRICHAVYKPDAIRLCGGLGAMFEPTLATLDALVRDRLTSVAREGWTLACVADRFLAARGVAALAERAQRSA